MGMNIRTDFLDYCMSKINSECESYAVRCFCIYTAYKMCRHFSELVSELEDHLDMMRYQTLSPGLKSALRKTKANITKREKIVKKRFDSHGVVCNRKGDIKSEEAEGKYPFRLNDLRTIPMGAERVRRNLCLTENADIVDYCCKLMLYYDAEFERKGKNWYITADHIRITVNAHSKTIITAHNV